MNFPLYKMWSFVEEGVLPHPFSWPCLIIQQTPVAVIHLNSWRVKPFFQLMVWNLKKTEKGLKILQLLWITVTNHNWLQNFSIWCQLFSITHFIIWNNKHICMLVFHLISYNVSLQRLPIVTWNLSVHITVFTKHNSFVNTEQYILALICPPSAMRSLSATFLFLEDCRIGIFLESVFSNSFSISAIKESNNIYNIYTWPKHLRKSWKMFTYIYKQLPVVA